MRSNICMKAEAGIAVRLSGSTGCMSHAIHMQGRSGDACSPPNRDVTINFGDNLIPNHTASTCLPLDSRQRLLQHVTMSSSGRVALQLFGLTYGLLSFGLLGARAIVEGYITKKPRAEFWRAVEKGTCIFQEWAWRLT